MGALPTVDDKLGTGIKRGHSVTYTALHMAVDKRSPDFQRIPLNDYLDTQDKVLHASLHIICVQDALERKLGECGQRGKDGRMANLGQIL